MNRTKEVEEVVGGRFVKLYDLTYEDKNGKDQFWRFASRRKLGETLAKTGVEKADAVVIVPMWIGPTREYTDLKFVVTKEYRAPLGGYEYGVPAGLIDAGENHEEAAARELKEETGLDMIRVHFSTPPLYSSAGLSDESTAIVFVECYGEISTEGNEELEDIHTMLVDPQDMADALKGESDIFSDGRIGAKGYLAWMFAIASAREMVDF